MISGVTIARIKTGVLSLMSPNSTVLILSYIAFVWLVVLHTLEEISCGIMELHVGHIKMTRNRYLLAAGVISTVNLGTLALLVLDLRAGTYLGLFTTAVLGVLQALVHGVGYLRENRNPRGLGAGFYSSIPLGIVGLVVFVQLIDSL
jgi:hypothetical protein